MITPAPALFGSGKEGRTRLKPVEERVVALVGASSGIGRHGLRRQGGEVVAAARWTGTRPFVAEIRDRGGEATAVVADAANPEDMEAVANRAVGEYGG